MTGRERMDVAMRLGVADCVPVMCQLSLGHYFLHGDRDPFFPVRIPVPPFARVSADVMGSGHERGYGLGIDSGAVER